MPLSESVQVQHWDKDSLTPEVIRAFVEQANREINRLRPDDPPAHPDEVVSQFMNLPPALTALELWAVMDKGTMVAQALMQCVSIGSNEDQAQVSLLIDPDWRRQGLGTELMREMSGLSLELGRTTLVATSTSLEPAGAAFLTACGLEAKQKNGENRLKLADLSPALLRDWTTRPNDGYTLEIWQGVIPDDQLEAYAELFSVMNDAPKDNVKSEEFRMTPELLRELQELRQQGNEDALTAVVRHKSGELVGLNELSWSRSEPTHVNQGGTGVKPAHRGHRLGQWLKAANILKLMEVSPQAKLIRTTNAVSNAPMLRINDEMGFRLYRTQTVWQGTTSEVLDRLGRK